MNNESFSVFDMRRLGPNYIEAVAAAGNTEIIDEAILLFGNTKGWDTLTDETKAQWWEGKIYPAICRRCRELSSVVAVELPPAPAIPHHPDDLARIDLLNFAFDIATEIKEGAVPLKVIESSKHEFYSGTLAATIKKAIEEIGPSGKVLIMLR